MFKFEELPDIIAENNRIITENNKLLAEIRANLPQKAPADLMNVHEASEYLNLSVPTIYSKVNRQELPFMKKGKKLYFSREELSQYVKSGKRFTVTEVGEIAIKKAATAMKGNSKH